MELDDNRFRSPSASIGLIEEDEQESNEVLRTD